MLLKDLPDGSVGRVRKNLSHTPYMVQQNVSNQTETINRLTDWTFPVYFMFEKKYT